MITLTKEWLQKTIAQLEEERDATPGAVNEDAAMALAAMKLAQASLEADSKLSDFVASQESLGVDFEKVLAENIEELYVPSKSTPPALVSVPEWTNEQCLEFLSIAFRHAEIKGDLELDDIRLGVKMVNGSHAAMLQGSDGALTNEDTKQVGELVMWVKRLAHSLRKANPDSKLQSDAMDYLSRKGLIGVEDILR